MYKTQGVLTNLTIHITHQNNQDGQQCYFSRKLHWAFHSCNTPHFPPGYYGHRLLPLLDCHTIDQTISQR